MWRYHNTSGKRRTRNLFVSGALLCLLVLAEALAVTHALDFEAHAADDVCKICIGTAGFGGAAPARAPVPLPRPATAPEPLPDFLPVLLARVERPSARGPPPAS